MAYQRSTAAIIHANKVIAKIQVISAVKVLEAVDAITGESKTCRLGPQRVTVRNLAEILNWLNRKKVLLLIHEKVQQRG